MSSITSPRSSLCSHKPAVRHLQDEYRQRRTVMRAADAARPSAIRVASERVELRNGRLQQCVANGGIPFLPILAPDLFDRGGGVVVAVVKIGVKRRVAADVRSALG